METVILGFKIVTFPFWLPLYMVGWFWELGENIIAYIRWGVWE